MAQNESADDLDPNRVQLVGYLEEALPQSEMVRIEELLRSSSQWRDALRELTAEIADMGDHSVATIWRRHRLTCPSREQLGTVWIGAADPQEEDYVRFHLEVVQCRWCLANLDDLKAQSSAKSKKGGPSSDEVRRATRHFESSVGYLPKRRH